MNIQKQYPIFGTEFDNLDLVNLTASEIEINGLYFEIVSVNKSLYEKIVGYYSDNDFFWKFETIRDEELDTFVSTYYGLSFSITKRSPTNIMGQLSEYFNTYHITQYSEGYDPESRKAERDFITAQQAVKLASLRASGKPYLTVYSLIAGIMKKHSEGVLNIVVWEKYVYYAFSKGSSYVSCQDIMKFIKGDKGIVDEPEEEHEGADLYDIFSDGFGEGAYVGDGVWISPDGNMHEP